MKLNGLMQFAEQKRGAKPTLYNTKKVRTMNENVFDLSDLSDLPKDLRSELTSLKRSSMFEERLLALLDLSDYQLNLNQLQVAYFRKYGEHKKRGAIQQKLYHLKKSELIEMVDGTRGCYIRINKD